MNALEKGAHSAWISNALGIIRGMEADHSRAPLLATESKFGKWFYTKGQSLSHLPHYKQVDRNLTSIHQLYMKMYALSFSEPKAGLFTSTKRLKRKNLEKAESLVSEFNITSEKLLHSMNGLEEEIQKMDDQKFLDLYQ